MRGRPYHGYIDQDIEGRKNCSTGIDLAPSHNQELTK